MSKANPNRVVRIAASSPSLTREEAKAIARRQLEEMSDEEDARLTSAALGDPDNPPLDPERRRPGRPPSSMKELVSLRLDRDVVTALRATGDGWQTRVNDTLRKSVGLK